MFGRWFSRHGKRATAPGQYEHGNRKLVELRQVGKTFETAAGKFTALKGIDLQVDGGEFVAVIGKSGSGKSTLINMITGIDHPTTGEVYVGDTAVHELSEGQLAVWRGHTVGIVFQFFQLLPTLSLVENVMLPMDFSNRYPAHERRDRALHLLEQMEMAEQARKLPAAISGGQQQRVAIARALANDPQILVADEPTGNLDSKSAEAVFNLFEGLVAKGKTILMVTHDNDLAARGTRAVVVADGRIVDEIRNEHRRAPGPPASPLASIAPPNGLEAALAERRPAVVPVVPRTLRLRLDFAPPRWRDLENANGPTWDTKRTPIGRPPRWRSPVPNLLRFGLIGPRFASQAGPGASSGPRQRDGAAPWLSPRWRKVLRDLGGNKSRTALVVLSIAVGVFAVGTVTSTRTILSDDLRVAYAASAPASATLVTSTPFDHELVRTARRVEGVAEAEGSRRATVRVETGPGEWKTLQLTARQDFQQQRLNKVGPQSEPGRPPRRELLIERSAFSLLKTRVGEDVTIETPDGKQHQIRVAGLAHDVGAPPAVFTGQVYGYATLETLEWLGLPRSFTDLHIIVSERPEDVTHIAEVTDRVKRKVEQSDNSVLRSEVPVPGEHPANQTIQPLLLILAVLGGFSVFLSGFLVVNTITALMTQQVPQIGVMKAIGARSGQLLAMYLGTVLVYGLLSLAVALPPAALAGYALTAYLAGLINFDLLGFRIPPATLALEATIALVVPLLAALQPVLAGTRLSVREALSSRGAGAFGAGRLDRLIERLRGLPRPVLLSLRNTFRRKARLALTLATLTLGGAIFIAVISVRASLITTLDAALEYWQYDVDVAFSQPHRIDRIVEEALQVPGVVAAESWAATSVQRRRRDGRDGPSIGVLAPPADTAMIKPEIVEGRWLRPGDDEAMVLNTAAAKLEPDLKVGDEVVFKLGKKETTWRIVGLARATLTGPIAYANQPTVARLTQSQGRASSVQVVTARHDAATQAAVATALKTRLDESRLRVANTQTITGLRDGVVKQFDIIVLLMAMMAVLMAVVGGLGLTGTMGINVLERSREIGIMRAIGAPTWAMLQIFLVEGMLIGVLSWLASAVLAYPISRLMSDGIGEALLKARLNFTFSLSGTALWLVVVLVLAALSSLLPALRAARITVREVLAYE